MGDIFLGDIFLGDLWIMKEKIVGNHEQKKNGDISDELGMENWEMLIIKMGI